MGNSLTSPAPKPASPLIFIVDDEPLVVELLETCLCHAGYATQSFCDPLAALRDFETAERKPDLLVTDYQMPGMDGMELIQRCKANHSSLKTVSISSFLTLSQLAVFDPKPDKCISKPFSPRKVMEVVKELLQPVP